MNKYTNVAQKIRLKILGHNGSCAFNDNLNGFCITLETKDLQRIPSIWASIEKKFADYQINVRHNGNCNQNSEFENRFYELI